MTETDLIREVDEELREDRARQWWQRHGKYVAAAAVAVILAVGAWSWWDQHRKVRAESDGAAFVQALDLARAGQTKAAADALAALAERAGGGYPPLARLQAAAVLGQSGDRAAAREQLDHVTGDAGADPALRELARLLIVYMDLDSRSAEDLRLALVAIPADSVWRPLTREASALVALRAGDSAGALALYKEIAEEAGIPTGLRERARAMVQALGGNLPAGPGQ